MRALSCGPYSAKITPMRWEKLFADLEARWSAMADAEFAAEVADRVRSEIARVATGDRLRAGRGSFVRLQLLGGTVVEGTLRSVGPDWLLVADQGAGGVEVLVVTRALAAVSGLGRGGAAPAPVGAAGAGGAVGARLDLAYALRQIARDRLPVVVTLLDATAVVGTIDRVGLDHLELAEHPAAEVRRAREISATRLIPTGAVAAVRLRRTA